MSRPRVSVEDLQFAADWMDAYEADVDDYNAERAERVAEWLRAEIEKRQTEAAVRQIAQRTGASPARARAALARVRSQG